MFNDREMDWYTWFVLPSTVIFPLLPLRLPLILQSVNKPTIVLIFREETVNELKPKPHVNSYFSFQLYRQNIFSINCKIPALEAVLSELSVF